MRSRRAPALWMGRHPAAGLVAVACATSWAAWGLAVAAPPRWAGWLGAAGQLGPLAAAAAVAAVAGDGRGPGAVRRLAARLIRARVGWRWWALALSPALVAAGVHVALTAAAVAGLTRVAPPAPASLGDVAGLPAAGAAGSLALLLLTHGLGGEGGWRGGLLPRLRRRHPPLAASLLAAAAALAWQAPAWLRAGAAPLPLAAAALVDVVAGAVFAGWLHDRGRRSVLLVATWRAGYALLTGSALAAGPLATAERLALVALAAVAAAQLARAARAARAVPGANPLPPAGA